METWFYKMNNDLKTINESEPSQRVSSFVRGLSRRQKPTLFYLPKKVVIEKGPIPITFFFWLIKQNWFLSPD